MKVCRQHQLFWSWRSLKLWLSFTNKTQLKLSSLYKRCEFWKKRYAHAPENHKRIWFFSEFQWIFIVSNDARQWIFLNTVVLIYIYIFCFFCFFSFFFLFFIITSLCDSDNIYIFFIYWFVILFISWALCFFFLFYFYLSQCLFTAFIYIC